MCEIMSPFPACTDLCLPGRVFWRSPHFLHALTCVCLGECFGEVPTSCLHWLVSAWASVLEKSPLPACTDLWLRGRVFWRSPHFLPALICVCVGECFGIHHAGMDSFSKLKRGKLSEPWQNCSANNLDVLHMPRISIVNLLQIYPHINLQYCFVLPSCTSIVQSWQTSHVFL